MKAPTHLFYGMVVRFLLKPGALFVVVNFTGNQVFLDEIVPEDGPRPEVSWFPLHELQPFWLQPKERVNAGDTAVIIEKISCVKVNGVSEYMISIHDFVGNFSVDRWERTFREDVTFVE